MTPTVFRIMVTGDERLIDFGSWSPGVVPAVMHQQLPHRAVKMVSRIIRDVIDCHPPGKLWESENAEHDIGAKYVGEWIDQFTDLAPAWTWRDLCSGLWKALGWAPIVDEDGERCTDSDGNHQFINLWLMMDPPRREWVAS